MSDSLPLLIEVRETPAFTRWLASLRDSVARKRIAARLERIQRLGAFGDVKPVGDGVSELRVDHGPGYRLYFVRRGEALVLMLGGGDKSSQARDIVSAKAMAKQDFR